MAVRNPTDSPPGAVLFGEVPARALAVYAHPDDPEISCGATLARWAQQGSEVHVLICARGEKGFAGSDLTADEVCARRLAEMDDAGRVLGLAGREQLRFDDGELENSAELREAIVAGIRRVRPDLVVCPDPTAVFFGDTYFNHSDHRVVGWAALDAVSPAAPNPRYFPNAGPAHRVPSVLLSGTLEPNVWVDVTSTIDAKVEAVLRHASQLEEGGEWFRDILVQRAEDGGRTAGVRHAEGFRRLALG